MQIFLTVADDQSDLPFSSSFMIRLDGKRLYLLVMPLAWSLLRLRGHG